MEDDLVLPYCEYGMIVKVKVKSRGKSEEWIVAYPGRELAMLGRALLKALGVPRKEFDDLKVVVEGYELTGGLLMRIGDLLMACEEFTIVWRDEKIHVEPQWSIIVPEPLPDRLEDSYYGVKPMAVPIST